MSLRKLNINLGAIAFFNGLLMYLTAVGIDSINKGVKGNTELNQEVSKAALIPLTGQNAWWPDVTLVDSIKFYRIEFKKVQILGNALQMRNAKLKDSLSLLKDGLVTAEVPSTNDVATLKCLNEMRC